jgi:tRNA (cytidine/uridine-2'-O-)-methyltransferase
VKIVLYQPQIPQNTGNVVRTCSVTGNELILVRPLGFSVNDRWLKRAGLDYWEGVPVTIIDEEELLPLLESTLSKFYFFSSKATQTYDAVAYNTDDYLIFGSESSGLPPLYAERWPEHFVTLPMLPGARCLNLATTVGIAVYEAGRQVRQDRKVGK